MNTRNRIQPPSSGLGYTLIELMIALVIALFLLGGMLSVLQGTGRTSSNQTALARSQNDQRIALTMMADVIQQAGYYPDIQTSTLQSAFPVVPALPTALAPAFTQAGQFIIGQTGATTNGDSITVRYHTDSTGTVFNCLGQNHDAVSVAHEYTFSVNDSKQLACSVDGHAPVPLVSNVQSLQILYGVDAVSTAAHAGTTTNAYVPANQMTAVNWTNVSSVKITLTFANPLSGQPGQGAAPALTFSRIVGVMAKAGVNVITET